MDTSPLQRVWSGTVPSDVRMVLNLQSAHVPRVPGVRSVISSHELGSLAIWGGGMPRKVKEMQLELLSKEPSP